MENFLQKLSDYLKEISQKLAELLKGISDKISEFFKGNQPVKEAQPVEETKPIEETPVLQTPVNAQLKEEANDPRAATTRRLLKYIARSSGLEIDEVQRRATRKQRALVHVTGWMALALVARDQGLDMESVIQALS